MRKFIVTACLFAGTFMVASCGSDNTNEDQATEAVATPGEPAIGGDSVLNDNQRELFNDIARHTLLQIELGKLASKRGVSTDVKDYAQRMVDLYTKKHQEFQEMAQTYQITLEEGIYEDYRDDVDDVTNAKQEEFDEQYWENVIDAQKDLLGEYDDVLKDKEETDASAFTLWARNSMKELRAHMEQAMTFDKRLRDRPRG